MVCSFIANHFFMRTFLLVFLLIFSFGVFSFCTSHLGTGNSDNSKSSKPAISSTKIKEAFDFAKKNKMDTTIALFIDFSIPSGKNRLFVYDLKNKKVLKSALCAHGSGTESFFSGDKVKFSNVPESHCSSEGKYKIGKRGWSNWGTHFNYKLHGLESSNSNAFKRIIVLHSYDMVGDKEIYPNKLVNSWGCPMVSNNTMLFLDKEIKKAKQPVLMWIYD